MENLEHVSPPALATSCCRRFMSRLVTKAVLRVSHSIRTRALVSYPAPSQALLIAVTTQEAALGAVRPLNTKRMLFVQIIHMKNCFMELLCHRRSLPRVSLCNKAALLFFRLRLIFNFRTPYSVSGCLRGMGKTQRQHFITEDKLIIGVSQRQQCLTNNSWQSPLNCPANIPK